MVRKHDLIIEPGLSAEPSEISTYEETRLDAAIIRVAEVTIDPI
jgi:hypothetical protein